MTNRSEIAATLAIVVLAVVVVALRIERQPDLQPDRSTQVVPADPDTDLVVDLPTADTLAIWYELGHRVGPEDAPIRIVEWGSYACSFCLEFAAAIDSVQQRFPDLISVIWLHALNPRRDLKGSDQFMAHATECVVDQVPFEALYKAVLLDRKRIDTRERLLAVASDIGVRDVNLLGACVDSWTHRDRVMRHAQMGKAAGITSTPTWFLNETRYDVAVPTAALQHLALARLRK